MQPRRNKGCESIGKKFIKRKAPVWRSPEGVVRDLVMGFYAFAPEFAQSLC
jgi:hypothetical protein